MLPRRGALPDDPLPRSTTRTRPRRPRAHLEIHGAAGTGTKDPPTTDFDLSASVVGGAVVSADAVAGAEIDLARDLESSLGLPIRLERSHLVATIGFEEGTPKLEKLSLVVPRIGEMRARARTAP